MAGVQALPPWLSFSQVTTTDTAGGLTTGSTIVFLPLTYFGPSIPLGTNGVWVFGGSTSPPPTTVASTILPSASSSFSSSSSQTATLSQSTSFSQQSSTSMSSSLTSMESSGSSSIAIFTTSTTNAPMPSVSLSSSGRGLNARAITAIVIVAVFVVILVAFLVFLWWRRRRSRRTPPAHGSTSSWSAFEIVGAEEGAAGDQSRPGGGDLEHEPLVSDEPTGDERSSPYTRPPGLDPDPASIHRNHPSAHGSSASGGLIGTALNLTDPTFPNASGLSFLYRPGASSDVLEYDDDNLPTIALSPAPRTTASPARVMNHHFSSNDIPYTLRADLLPTTIQPALSSNSSSNSRPSMAYPDSPVSDIDETAALMTARRVRVDGSNNPTQPVGWGLGGLARLSRISWFNRHSSGESRSTSHSRPSSHVQGFTTADSVHQQYTDMLQVNRNSLSVASSRGSSGQSMYFDAASRIEPFQEASAFQSSHQIDFDPLDIPAPPSAMASISSKGSRTDHLAFPPGLERPSSDGVTLNSHKSLLSFHNRAVTLSGNDLNDDPPRGVGRWEIVKEQFAEQRSWDGSQQDIYGHQIQRRSNPYNGSYKNAIESNELASSSANPLSREFNDASNRMVSSSNVNTLGIRLVGDLQSIDRNEDDGLKESAPLSMSDDETVNTITSGSSIHSGTAAGTSITAATTIMDPIFGLSIPSPTKSEPLPHNFANQESVDNLT